MEGLTSKIGEEVRKFTDAEKDGALVALDDFFQITDCTGRAFVVLSIEETPDGVSAAVSCLGLDEFETTDQSEVGIAKSMSDVGICTFAGMIAKKGIQDNIEHWIDNGMSAQLGAMAAAEFKTDEELEEFRAMAKDALGLNDSE